MKDYAELFNIEKGFIALNHGSFGACPKAVLKYYSDLNERMESLTTRFFTLELKPLMLDSLKYLATFINAPLDNLVFVRNTTTAAYSVLNSLSFDEGDEIVTTNFIYEACRYQLNHLSATKGVVLKFAQIPFPVDSEEQIVTRIFEKLTAKTKLVFLDHVSSETAVVMPLERICKRLKTLNIPVFIDGAHAPGMLPLDLQKLAPDFYAGNCHKWLCAPKGSAFLYVSPEKKEDMLPPVISFFFRSGKTLQEQFFNSFFWTGTANDYLSCITVKYAIEYLNNSVEGGWQEIMKRNRKLVRTGRDIIKEKLDLEQHTPEEMTGTMVTFRLNSKSDKEPGSLLDRLFLQLLDQCKIETFIGKLYHSDERILRISAHLYNKESDYERLADCLKKLL